MRKEYLLLLLFIASVSLILPHRKHVPPTEYEVSKCNRSWWEILAKIVPVNICGNSVSQFLRIKDVQFDMMKSQIDSVTCYCSFVN